MTFEGLRVLAASLPVSALLAGALVLFLKTRSADASLQLAGAACFLVVVLAHVAEAFDLFPSMQWGRDDSLGHYLDLGSALFGLAAFPVGYLWQALRQARSLSL